ncbi:DUF5916 domain-containing protein [Marinilabilia sp.]|uniref:DUF5916 domain-containing protein n=1 Tax=Marinilabilia sp. TaxID=2021252 RepID=UPI0025BAECD8|nr:DUF5916 domain-containing protein [Marinilabilia sp.]
MKGLPLIPVLLFISSSLWAQAPKEVEALSVSEPLTIDAVLDEPFYNQISPATDFRQLAPHNGEPSFQKSEVWFFYDQSAIYVGAMLHDNSPDSIFNFLSERDRIGMSDYFGVYFDPYNEGQLAFGFFVTPAGVQTDIKAIKKENDIEDGSWDAVWESNTRITDKGWIVEMRIPYSAVRFPNKPAHIWGLNMFRNIRRYNSNNSWSPIDRNIAGFIHQQGQLNGIENIEPPVRLSFSPYVATYLEYKDSTAQPDFIYKAGLDLKYGISESYTLDMMLIPDFGQIQSDDKQLNLSPYETYYDEKRQFFNEGIELFQRADIFYSRRIGSNPKFADNADDALREHETIKERPSETQLANATKVSGRNDKGLAVGVLNAMSLKSYATLEDTLAGNTREILIQPFTNYNVTTIDQSLNNNSYLSFINTNVSMANHPFMANVTATEFQFRDKRKTYALSGKGGMSYRKNEERQTGWFGELSAAKNSGSLQFGTIQRIISDDFDPNDLGYLRRNNEMYSEFWLSYHIVEPFWVLREWHYNMWYQMNRVVTPFERVGEELGFYSYSLFKNNYGLEINGGLFSKNYDYYEARIKNRFLVLPRGGWFNIGMFSDNRKSFQIYTYFQQGFRPGFNETEQILSTGFDWRIGQHLQISYDLEYSLKRNNYGYVDCNDSEDSIYIARRNIRLYENQLEMAFAFNKALSMRLRGRHYWSAVANHEYYFLSKDGSLIPQSQYPENHDNNFNALNIDLIVRWIFAPGSEISLGWKNAILESKDNTTPAYWKNFRNIWSHSQTNTFSIKCLYYIDYNRLRKRRKTFP